MGLDLTVLAVDWERLERTPFEERYALLEDAAMPEDELDRYAEPQRGWVWPAASNVPWCGRYEFHSTPGCSYKPHFWAGQAWEDVREHAGPEPREHLDAFLRNLIWDTDTEDASVSGLFPADPDPWHRRLLLFCPPATVSAPGTGHEPSPCWRACACRTARMPRARGGGSRTSTSSRCCCGSGAWW
ncbi:hypothetical protein OG873_01300 [Streptomyces violaceus]|uniref:hypothetical protein n=1 Tax=Streptomyces violaceus TaxID=1936 RepID=UPI002E2E6951|nr:hypothetical protein [Streptomyces violaceus]